MSAKPAAKATGVRQWGHAAGEAGLGTTPLSADGTLLCLDGNIARHLMYQGSNYYVVLETSYGPISCEPCTGIRPAQGDSTCR